MPTALRKALIAMGTAFLVVFIYGVFDPSLRYFVYAILISVYLTVFKIVAGFTFKKGVMSVATIAWKRIFVVGGTALFRRFWIDFFKKNAVEHVVKPLMPHLKKWGKVHFEEFKGQPMWMKFSETTIGVAIITSIGYFVGVVGWVFTLVEKVLTGKFQSFFLSLLGMFTSVLGWIWDRIKPWLDVIMITALINFLGKIRFIRAIFHRTKKVKDKVVQKKDSAIKKVVHRPVQSLAKAIDGHAEKKIQRTKDKAATDVSAAAADA